MHEESERILDELLVLRCRRGDQSAWRQLVPRFEKRLFYFIRRLVGNERDAWDILQQTWLAAFKGIGSFAEPRMLRTWLYRIARNNAITHIRRRGQDPSVIDPTELPQREDATDDSSIRFDDEPLPPDAAQEVHEALASLSVPHREVLTLHFLEDASIDEIAAVIDVPPGTVKSRLHYAKRALRCAIEKRRELA